MTQLCRSLSNEDCLQLDSQVYKTVSKGWACRSWDFIPAGAPICEYFGTLRRNDEHLESMLDNSYIFELDLVQTMQGMEGRQVRCLFTPINWLPPPAILVIQDILIQLPRSKNHCGVCASFNLKVESCFEINLVHGWDHPPFFYLLLCHVMKLVHSLSWLESFIVSHNV